MKVFVIGGTTGIVEDESELKRLSSACQIIGSAVASMGHDLILCSPFQNSADAAVLIGAAPILVKGSAKVEFNFVDTNEVRSELDKLISKVGVTAVRIPHPAPPSDYGTDAMRYSWLLCQLRALDACHIVIAIGGKECGSANMLLQLAESKRKPTLPFPFFGGAAEIAFHRRRYELADRLDNDLTWLLKEDALSELSRLLDALAAENPKRGEHQLDREPQFFISYSRARVAEADFVETLLRRRNQKVFRDESEFGAGHAIPNEIHQAIYACDVFIALWCQEYACSPWCYDELSLALDRLEHGAVSLWILCLDETRMVQPRARDLISYRTRSREELEGRVVELLARHSNTLPK